jgi:Brp/Blh family beta-carotene 15,15'-monooxygenase
VLVELTRFGTQILPAELAEQRLADYMAVVMKNQGDYRIVHREEGIIPMAEHPGENPNTFPGVLNLGTRNQALKPSTGYAFKTMYQQARDLAQHWSAFASANKDHHSLGSTTKPWKPQQAHPRYAFLDGLLLHILRQRPHQGKAIFEQLFAGSPLPSVLRFMDEKSGWQEDLRMFMHLPWKPFGVALWEKYGGWPLRLLLFTFGLMVVQALSPAYTVLANLTMGLGLLMVGLPHGAVDHLLQTGLFRKVPTPAMILTYLGLGGLMLWFWFLWPWWSLLFFVGYSAWHFGQADGRSWGLNPLESLAWGLSVLAHLTGTHAEETRSMVKAMTHQDLTWSLAPWWIMLWTLFAVFRSKSALVWISLGLLASSYLPLMHAFALYFLGQHSRTGWQDLRQGLQRSSASLWWAALPFHAGAWLLLGLFYAFRDRLPALDFGLEGSFFVFLACLSFPHVVTMHRFYGRKES